MPVLFIVSVPLCVALCSASHFSMLPRCCRQVPNANTLAEVRGTVYMKYNPKSQARRGWVGILLIPCHAFGRAQWGMPGRLIDFLSSTALTGGSNLLCFATAMPQLRHILGNCQELCTAICLTLL